MTSARLVLGLFLSGIGSIAAVPPAGPTDALFTLHALAGSSIIIDDMYWLRPDGTFIELYGHSKASALPANYASGDSGTYTFSTSTNGASSRDIALAWTTPSGPFTQAMTLNFATGTTTYQATYSNFTWMTRTTSAVANTSAHTYVSAGHSSIAGFVLSEKLWVLIRGVGPALGAFHVTDALPNPKLRIYSGSNLINDSEQYATADFYAGQYFTPAPWYSDARFVPGLNAVFAMVGAFPLGSSAPDRATLMLLDPGAYTVELTSTDGATSGSALAEVYVLPYSFD